MKLFLILLFINVIIFTILFLFCACKLSSKADKNIELTNQEKKIN